MPCWCFTFFRRRLFFAADFVSLPLLITLFRCFRRHFSWWLRHDADDAIALIFSSDFFFWCAALSAKILYWCYWLQCHYGCRRRFRYFAMPRHYLRALMFRRELMIFFIDWCFTLPPCHEFSLLLSLFHFRHLFYCAAYFYLHAAIFWFSTIYYLLMPLISSMIFWLLRLSLLPLMPLFYYARFELIIIADYWAPLPPWRRHFDATPLPLSLMLFIFSYHYADADYCFDYCRLMIFFSRRRHFSPLWWLLTDTFRRRCRSYLDAASTFSPRCHAFAALLIDYAAARPLFFFFRCRRWCCLHIRHDDDAAAAMLRAAIDYYFILIAAYWFSPLRRLLIFSIIIIIAAIDSRCHMPPPMIITPLLMLYFITPCRWYFRAYYFFSRAQMPSHFFSLILLSSSSSF